MLAITNQGDQGEYGVKPLGVCRGRPWWQAKRSETKLFLGMQGEKPLDAGVEG